MLNERLKIVYWVLKEFIGEGYWLFFFVLISGV